jgi:hypothetical protein
MIRMPAPAQPAAAARFNVVTRKMVNISMQTNGFCGHTTILADGTVAGIGGGEVVRGVSKQLLEHIRTVGDQCGCQYLDRVVVKRGGSNLHAACLIAHSVAMFACSTRVDQGRTLPGWRIQHSGVQRKCQRR